MAFILKNLRWVLLPCLPRSQVLGGLSHVVLPPPPPRLGTSLGKVGLYVRPISAWGSSRFSGRSLCPRRTDIKCISKPSSGRNETPAARLLLPLLRKRQLELHFKARWLEQDST